jgi:hypothetical protein
MFDFTATSGGLEISLLNKEAFEEAFLYEIETDDDENIEEALIPIEVYEILDFDGRLGNGWSDLTGEVGLTDSPIIAYNVSRNDEGDLEIHDDSEIYYFSNYMIENPWETLHTTGKVVFQKVD